jgi:putative Mg2+ transporter-C (MgtC) family protein
MDKISVLDFVVRLSVAFLLGSLIGLERQWRQRMAGLRTNTLVATGAALFVMLSVLTPGDSSPSRIAAQVVSGIGFLAGGVILREGLTVRGLNTAATIWCAAAIGSLSGAGFILQAAIGATAVLSANILLRPLVSGINQQSLKGTELTLCYNCSVTCQGKHESHIRALLLQMVNNNSAMKLRSLHSEDIVDSLEKLIQAELLTQDRNDAFLEQIVSHLSLESKVSAVSWKIIEEIYG